MQFENLISIWSCTGGVIANDLVVTNAHCIEGSPLAVTVFPGLNHSSYSYGYYRATEIIYPEEYDSGDNSSAYDYAILRVVPDSGHGWITIQIKLCPLYLMIYRGDIISTSTVCSEVLNNLRKGL
ncbi:hypothetical protein CVD25_17380 [Bacillus canaveralius]|uniref:Peptidase S1 domain-containing protein n=1 Tax=Bacillus canaveralius TaxID=1403243 RepID=A0A2N5GSZ0_9BACI|nr:hypothetical protein CU635_00920 [Bacillus canaveralius]PLR93371.1 hypothetical protein CVD25_17380 [Bacillus canaveralius]